MLQGIKDTLVEHAKVQTETLTEVKHINTRVTSLERWQDRTIGGMAVLTLVVMPILGWALYKIANNDRVIQDSVDRALTRYNIDTETNP